MKILFMMLLWTWISYLLFALILTSFTISWFVKYRLCLKMHFHFPSMHSLLFLIPWSLHTKNTFSCIAVVMHFLLFLSDPIIGAVIIMWLCIHYGDIIMGMIASQITSLTIVYSTFYSDADQRKHQRSMSLAFVWGIHRGPVNSPHKWPMTQKMFPFDDVIM